MDVPINLQSTLKLAVIYLLQSIVINSGFSELVMYPSHLLKVYPKEGIASRATTVPWLKFLLYGKDQGSVRSILTVPPPVLTSTVRMKESTAQAAFIDSGGVSITAVITRTGTMVSAARNLMMFLLIPI